MSPINKYLKAIRQLGLRKLWLFSLYQLGLKSGYYRIVTPQQIDDFRGEPSLGPIRHTPKITPAQKETAIQRADEVRSGLVRLFGGEPIPLELKTGASKQHWSGLDVTPPEKDIKLIWESGRFGWAITLARAYAFSGDPVYAHDFWQKTSEFLDAHPANLGRQWQSAQEVAIRLMALIFCDRVFSAEQTSPTVERQRLWQAIAEHAQRIPPTLVYARAQNNNHLLTEAAGLYTAGTYLADHPQAKTWQRLGLRWLNWGFQNQIDEFGTYTQHSTNYHRLMLQVALFADHFRRLSGAPHWPLATQAKLVAATRWLWALTDPETGQVPNLGANDGAYLFPLTNQVFHDYRPVVDAAAKAFLNEDPYQQPALSEMARWFELEAPALESSKQPQAPDMLREENEHRRAFIHTAQYTDRPSHADQLHVDLWWRGVNIALDPGTYQYNAPPPWDNALATARVHNTLTLDGQDQMTRAGRFLWLDWAQAQVLAYEVDALGQIKRVTAEHNGYRRLGALHQRTLLRQAGGWRVIDAVLPYGKPDPKQHDARLAWLLPDWPWEFLAQNWILLTGPHFKIQLKVEGADQVHLVRAGECLVGEINPEPSWGWRSSIYGEKSPAVMVLAQSSGLLPIEFNSIWEMID